MMLRVKYTQEAKWMTSYKGWNMSHHILSKQPFVTYDHFCEFVANFHYVNFHNKENRDHVRQTWMALPDPTPFSKETRFPKDEIYVHLFNPNIMVCMNNIMHSLDIPPVTIVKGLVYNASSRDDTLRNARKAYNLAFDDLASFCGMIDVAKMAEYGIYCQETFEACFGLIWYMHQ